MHTPLLLQEQSCTFLLVELPLAPWFERNMAAASCPARAATCSIVSPGTDAKRSVEKILKVDHETVQVHSTRFHRKGRSTTEFIASVR